MDFPDLLRKYGIDFSVHGDHPKIRDGNIGLECPWCGKGTGVPGLSYHLTYGYLNCWKCGPHRTGDLLAELTGMPLGKCVGLVMGLETVRPDRIDVRGKLTLPKGVGPMSAAHRKYVRSRGFDPDELTRLWGVMGIGISSQLPWHLFIPVVWRGQTVSWTARSISAKASRRYCSASVHDESVPHRTLLLGLDYVRHTIVVVEGPFDVFRVGPGAACTFGVGYTRAQLCCIARFPRRVICYDADSGAQDRAGRLCDDLAVFRGTTVRVTLDGDDPASAPEKEIRLLRRYLD